jgi:hypothetical protein
MSLKLAKSEKFSWMDNQQLNGILEHIPEFHGVYAIDTLPHRVHRYPAAFVVNTDQSNGPGEHWLAVYFDVNGNAEFFDSYGYSPEMYGMVDFLLNNSRKGYIRNNKRLQSSVTFVCGAYCVYFLMMKCSGVKEWLQPFGSDFILNDCIVLDFVHRFALE